MPLMSPHLSACARRAAALIALLPAVCLAGPADDSRAHFQAIAAGDVAALMAAYAPQAQFHWVGGPLDGSYAGTEAIQALWTRFVQSQGPLKLGIGSLEESANPKGATVTANLLFQPAAEGKAPIKVRHVLTWRDGRIVGETWQIDPRLNVAAAP